MTLDGSYDWRLSPRDTMIVSAGFRADFYSRVPTSDLLDHSLSLTYRHRFDNDLAASFRASDSFTLIDGRAFRNLYALRPAVAYRGSRPG